MPIKAWIEVRDLAGNLLETVESRIDGGTVLTDYPVFPTGTRGRVTHRRQYADGRTWSWQDDPELLPSSPITQVSEEG